MQLSLGRKCCDSKQSGHTCSRLDLSWGDLDIFAEETCVKCGELIEPNVRENDAGVVREALREVGGEGSQNDPAGPEYPVTTEHREVKEPIRLVLDITNSIKCILM